MLSAVIYPAHRQPAVPLARQLAHERCVRPGPLVLGTAPLKPPTPAVDRDRHFCYSRPNQLDRGPGHFCLALHVAMQVGPYLHPICRDVWHMVSEDSDRHIAPCTRRYRPPPFIERASSTSFRNPSSLRCSFNSIARTTRAKVRNSCCFELRRGCVWKNGITFVRRSRRSRTTNTSVVSFDPRWFGWILPQSRRCFMRSRTSRRSTL